MKYLEKENKNFEIRLKETQTENNQQLVYLDSDVVDTRKIDDSEYWQHVGSRNNNRSRPYNRSNSHDISYFEDNPSALQFHGNKNIFGYNF
jgi:hypothetical protein